MLLLITAIVSDLLPFCIYCKVNNTFKIGVFEKIYDGLWFGYSCLWYCKDIHLEANHNSNWFELVRSTLFMILQRYTFESKSQLGRWGKYLSLCCLWYCKDIHLKANHNKQLAHLQQVELLMILQRYTFGSKSQPENLFGCLHPSCLWYCKDIHLEANHNIMVIMFKN